MQLLGYDCGELKRFQKAFAEGCRADGAGVNATLTDLLARAGLTSPAPEPVLVDDEGRVVKIDRHASSLAFIPYQGAVPLEGDGGREHPDFEPAPSLSKEGEEPDQALFAEALGSLADLCPSGGVDAISEIVISAIGLLGDVPALIASRALASTGDQIQNVMPLAPYGGEGLAGVHGQLQAAAGALAARGDASPSTPFGSLLDEGWSALADLNAGAHRREGEGQS